MPSASAKLFSPINLVSYGMDFFFILHAFCFILGLFLFSPTRLSPAIVSLALTFINWFVK
ncbi:hypothetical protein RchiOBHm_Chr1g0322211 [Rosa chinensis]|uniref:Uncharacterized protein n=1 Tax=Rosa chinensis TaxID=74649 RepID=A0A2P6S950_ROSCH|nr:hypothetical protein RchiOBHm_Chr1g0322211 [Rosa chinensis]